MIEQLFEQYSPLQLPVESQYRLAFGVSLTVFLLAALIRETVQSPQLRWLARAAGAAAFFTIAGYANHATNQIVELNRELFAKEGKKISVEHAVTLTSKQGHKIAVGNESNGVRRIAAESMERLGRLRQRADSSISGRGGIAASSMDDRRGIGNGDGGVLAIPRVPEWIRSAYGTARDAAGIQQSGKAQGKDF
jgi:hypothetical protein